ncbi:MAG: hypothetical protein OFPI_06440 [Osedax symbiont Rs2]|nr:MAG: hypothetical protein OFPI_06440 [Osedax symbiont Rs2]
MHSEKNSQSYFTKRFMLSMLLFLLLIAAQTFTIELLQLSDWLLIVVTLVPILPLLWAFIIFKQRFQTLDEYMQRLTGEAFLWMLGIVCFASFAYGMLAMKLAMPQISAAYILPAVFAGHGLILRLLLKEADNEK